MLIDWFTVGAQALNFLVLVWLMKRFLYKPILDAIDVREKRIAAELADASAKKAEAQKERDEFQHKNDAQNLNQAITRRAQQEVFAITRKALTDLATVSLEERMGEVFTRRLREMNGKAKECVAGALKTASDPGLVRSTFDLPAEQRAAIQNALNETFASEVHIRFETAPDLIGGIEFTTNGQKVAWSIADYLASLERGVGELLNKQAVAKSQ
jgi:F-type H+-transporting ATPase subunit b